MYKKQAAIGVNNHISLRLDGHACSIMNFMLRVSLDFQDSEGGIMRRLQNLDSPSTRTKSTFRPPPFLSTGPTRTSHGGSIARLD